jgi:VRR-NUC domain
MSRFGTRTPDFVFTYLESQRERFRTGELADDWRSRYPELFDELDLKLAKNQEDYHFVEWLGAVLLFESIGYRSLVESYVASTHPEKRRKLEEVVGLEIADWLKLRATGLPDLFVYNDKTKDWFVCEVKGPGDSVGDGQSAWYDDFEQFIKARGVPGVRLRLMQLKRIVL